jgi:hypothetical protein
MMCLQTPLAKRIFALAGTAVMAAAAASCSPARAEDAPNVGLSQQAALSDTIKSVAAACGLACPGDKNDEGAVIKGIADGNASISGVASVDAFFGSVVSFQNAAGGVAGGIKAQLDAIRGDFGIAADADLAARLDAQFKANLDGTVEFKVEPAKCEADVKATLKAQARCEGTVNPGSVKVACSGGCEVDASVEAKCDANADLQCTVVPPNLMCTGGTCQGSCTTMVTAMADCTGTCRGKCEGTCSAFVKNASGDIECAGKCEGMCTGSCEAEFAVAATCSGQCKGECTFTNPEAGCTGAIKAECKGKADAKVMCDGKCDGEFDPPSAKVECKASAKADAKINVQCTPPRVALSYKLKAGVEAKAQAKFEAALKVLISSRLPALKASLARANSVTSAGADLTASAGGALERAFSAAATGSVRVQFGLTCAVAELPKVKAVIEKSTTGLKAQIDAAAKVTSMLKV